jgi:hypothetical protein
MLYCFFRSCDRQDFDIQIPERVFERLNILEKDLSFKARNGSSLSFDYRVTNAKEQIKFDASIEKDRLHSVLSYKKDDFGWVEVSNFDIDFQEVIDKKNMNFIVEKHAKTLKRKFDVKTVGRIADILEGLPELLFNELDQKEYMDESTLSIFYHLAAFNTARRAYESRQSADCQCEINHKYLSGKSPFFCVEDLIVSADWAYNLIVEKSKIKKSQGHQFNPETLLTYLSKESGKVVSVYKLDKLLRNELVSFWRKLNEKERQKILSESHSISEVPRLRNGNEHAWDMWLALFYTGWNDGLGGSCWSLDIVFGSD